MIPTSAVSSRDVAILDTGDTGIYMYRGYSRSDVLTIILAIGHAQEYP